MNDIATKYLGARFRLHGRDRKTGLDCLGLSLLVAREYGHELPDVALDYERDVPDGTDFEAYLRQAESHLEPIHPSRAEPGDIVAFDTRRLGIANHFGVVVGGGLAITTFENSGAVLVNLKPWRNRTKGIFRVVKPDPTNTDR